jgi:deoxyribonuclease-4
MSHLFGAHMSIAGGHHKAATAARAAGFDTVQVFTKSSNQWKAKPLTDADLSAWKAALAELKIVDPVAHNSYLINLASPDDALWEKSIDAMTVEVERCEALGIRDLVAHPGAHVGSGEEAGLARIAKALDEVHRRTRGLSVSIDLETTAGQGSCLGCQFEHLGAIFAQVAEPDRLGVCVDTCHVFAAGYSMHTHEGYNRAIEALDRHVGVPRVRVWHLNDSVKPCGSRVDRHAGIGRGQLGLEAFRLLLTDPRFDGLRMVLETPKGEDEGEDLDVRNLRILRELEPGRTPPEPGPLA